MSPRVLLTGFEPFGGAPVNPSWQAVAAVAARAGRRGGAEGTTAEITVVAERLPVVFGGLRERLAGLLRAHRPDVVIAVGLAAGRERLTVEERAVNLTDARIPDGAGQQPRGVLLRADGPAELRSTLGPAALLPAARAAGLDVAASGDAGRYVCNATLYHLLDLAAQLRPAPLVGFVHVPATGPDSLASHDPMAADPGAQAPVPIRPLAELVAALEAMVGGAVVPLR